MSYEYDPDEYAEDPFANPYGYDEQAMIDYWVANGAGAAMIPAVQPGSGKALTVANRGSALNNYRSSLFDTAFMGLGGPQAFAPGTFDPIVSTSIRQSPELNQVYGYLRSPTSMEGIIAQEMMTGGTPATARRALQQMLTATPEEVAMIFAGYDEFFGREPTVTAAQVPEIKTNLLLELPAALDDIGQPMVKKEDGTGINWDIGEFSVDARANTISELQAEIPRIGPSQPQWTIGPDGTPIQTSAGGELSWGFDEQGNPVLMETTVTESEAAKTFTDVGLPNPAEEYTAESFMTPDQIAMQQAYGEMDPVVAQLKQAWMDPSLAPSNTNGPNDRPWEAPANLTPEQLAVHGPGGTQMANRSDADLLNRYRQGQDVVGTEGQRVVEMPNWEVDPYAAEFGGFPIGSGTGVPPVPGIPAGDVQRPGFDYRDWVPPVDRGDEDWVPPTNAVGEVDELGGIYYGNDYTGTGQAATTPTSQMTNAMLAAVIGGAAPQRGATPPTQPRPVSASDQLQNQAQAEANAPDWLSHAPGSILTGAGGTQAPNPVTFGGQPVDQYQAEAAQRQAMMRYTLPEMATGERSARGQQAEADQQQAQILGGSTNRTGKRVRPTRTGEQARQYRAAFEAWDLATDQQQQAKQQAYNFEAGQAAGEAWKLRAAGVRPIDQALMARRLVLMNAGMPQGI